MDQVFALLAKHQMNGDYWRNKKHFNNVNRIGKRRIRLQHGILADCYAEQKEENFCDQSRKLFILTALGFYCFYIIYVIEHKK